jgi:hypothetical protein
MAKPSLLLEAERILGDDVWSSLVRPVPASPARIKDFICPVVSLKLDGVRVALVLNSSEVFEVRAKSFASLKNFEHPLTSSRVTVLDCEQRGDTFYVLDTLVAEGRDLRSLPLEERINCDDLPAELQKKPYRGADGQQSAKEAVRRALTALGAAGRCADGLIILDASEPYWTPPLKFKPCLTSDFLIEKSKNSDDYVIFTSSGGNRSVPWRESEYGPVVKVTLPLFVARHLKAQITRQDKIIVECTRSEAGKFRVCALRRDRLRPNKTAVVTENVELQAAGCNRADWLLSTLPCRDRVKQFWNYVEICWRALVLQVYGGCSCIIDLREGSSACAPAGIGLQVYGEHGIPAVVSGITSCKQRRGVQAASGNLRGEKLALLLCLNLDKIGNLDSLSKLCSDLGAEIVAGLILQPSSGSSQDLYRCTSSRDGSFRLQMGTFVESTTYVDLSKMPSDFCAAEVRLPRPTEAMGVGSDAKGLLSGLHAFAWRRQ